MAYADERLELLSRLRKLTPGRALPDAFAIDRRSLRFHLGTSLADMRVPVSVDPQLVQAFELAARDLLYLLAIRDRAALREGDWDRLLLLDGFDPKSGRPVSFTPPAQVKSEGVRRAFLEGPELHPALDSGVLAGWIAQGRPGRNLVAALNALFRRGLRESAGKEPTCALALLALRPAAELAMASLRAVPLGPPMGRVLAGATALGLFVAVRLAAREAGMLQRAAGSPFSAVGMLAEAALSPLQWLGSTARQVAGSGARAWGVVFTEPPPRLELFARRIAEGASPDLVAREVLGDLNSSADLARKAERAGALSTLRGELLAILRATEAGRAPPLSLEGHSLAQLYSVSGALERVLAAPERRLDLAAKAKLAAKVCTTEAARASMLTLETAARQWRDEEPASNWLGVPQAHEVFAASVAALALDLALERLLDPGAGLLLHRDGSESLGGLAQEHESGKLYLFAFDERPIVMARPAQELMAHLFCDVKDFTRRTALLKETVVADFLSREFYTPILTAAASYHHGATHLGDKGGIYLNNLLGDAVSFSGDVVALVGLSHDIRLALENYGVQLARSGLSEAVSSSIAGIEERFGARKALLDASLLGAQAARKKGTLDLESGEEPGTRVRSLFAELSQLAGEREGELALASGEKLEAGIFLSYGAAPEVATFEDAVFGDIRVSIAEKINESARGTARNSGVRARVDSLVAQSRSASPGREAVCPFQVLISQPLSIAIPPELEAAVRTCLELGDAEAAEALLSEGVRGLLARLAGEGASAPGGDIYNGGVALSEEALRAYVEARASSFLFLKRELPVAALHLSIRERFIFPMQNLKLVCAVEGPGQSLHELYAFAGRALFRGFEKNSGLGVYELVAPHSAFFNAIAEHHLPQWLRESQHQIGSRT